MTFNHKKDGVRIVKSNIYINLVFISFTLIVTHIYCEKAFNIKIMRTFISEVIKLWREKDLVGGSREMLISTCFNQLLATSILVKTPGFPGLAHPIPQDTRPQITPLQDNGPPESPWQASFSSFSSRVQNWISFFTRPTATIKYICYFTKSYLFVISTITLK